MSADKGQRPKNAGGREKQRGQARAFSGREDPQGGRGSPTRGRTHEERGADILAIPTSDLSPSSQDDVPVSGFGSPLVDFDAPIAFPRLQKFRDLSAKSAGIDPATGKVVPHARDEGVAKVVAQMAAVGTPINTIAVALNIRPGQLRKYYPNELEHSAELANSQVALTAFRMATSGEDPATTKFWLKSRNGWKDGEKGDGDSMFNIHIHD